MRKKIQAMIQEKDKLRGLVPSRYFGNRDRTYGAYLNALKPRENEELKLALACSRDTRFQEFLARINAERYRRVGLPTIAKACGIDLMEFSQWWRLQSTQAAIAIAQTSSVNLTKDMVLDAASTDVICDRCDGLAFVGAPSGLPTETPGYRAMHSDGEIMWIRTCPNCVGGRVRKPGDTHARDKLLEMSGLVKKGAPININIDNYGGVGHNSAISQLDEAMAIDVQAETGAQ
jgi:hypothetical protein